MKRRKVILHIGTMKTGTSSIQAALKGNKAWLAERGWAFVGWPARKSGVLTRRITRLTGDNDIVISDEGLWHFADSLRSDTAAMAQALKPYDVTVLVYFRRPDEFFESWFSQGLKTGTGAMSFANFETSAFVRTGSQFVERLNIFARLYGAEAIRIAPFERSQLANGDIVSDFLLRSGIVARDELPQLHKSGFVASPDQNRSPDAARILLCRMLRQFGKIDPQIVDMVMHAPDAAPENQDLLTGTVVGKTPKARLLYADEIARVNARYRPAFVKLQEMYGDVGDTFFRDWGDDPKSIVTTPLRGAYDLLTASPGGSVPVKPQRRFRLNFWS